MLTTATIAKLRLAHQLIDRHAPMPPETVVHRMGMVQAQDYPAALWAVGLRTPQAAQDDIEQALADGKVVRTWPARGTLHFAAAEDVRWLLALLARRVIQHTAGRYRQLGLDEADFNGSRAWLSRALQGGNRLKRDEIFHGLEAAHISTAGQRGIHILGRLAQEGLICFGPRDGKQHTFVLLDEWLPQAPTVAHDQALADLTRRYFSSHGPATVQDFTWWSGLTVAEARLGLELAQAHLTQDEAGGKTYWRPRSSPARGRAAWAASLLPAFDEYLVGYADRRSVLDPKDVKQTNAGGGMLSPVIVIDGRVVGTWRRVLKKGTVVVTPNWFQPPEAAQQQALEQAAGRYGDYLGLQAKVE